jgi:hypothetical protein
MARLTAPLPFATFGDLHRLGLAATVYCPGCRRQTAIAITPELSGRRVIVRGRDFRCRGTLVYGDPCGARGLLCIRTLRRDGS